MRKSLLKRVAVVAMSLALAFSMQTTTMAMSTATITAKAAAENVGECTISLTKKGAKRSLTLGPNKSLSLIVKDKGAVVDSKNLKFASSKSAVASVKKGVITTKKTGTTKITITNKKTKNKATLTIKVDNVNVTSLTLSAKTLNLNVGQSATLTAAVAPEYSAVPVWTSFFPEVATVNNGVVTAKAAGTGIIVVNAGGKMEFCRVNVGGGRAITPVTSLTLSTNALSGDKKLNSTDTITPTIAPAKATNKTLKWTSSDENVATVNQSGVVTYKGLGTCAITATTTDGSGLSASCAVNVTGIVKLEKKKLGESNTFAEVIDDGTDVIISITGTGSMPDYANDTDRPWQSIASEITKLNIGSDVTAIGKKAFHNCNHLSQAIGLNSPALTSIGELAFGGDSSDKPGCPLTHIVLSKNLNTIDDYAFYRCTDLLDVIIEKGGICNLSIGDSAFNICNNLLFVCLPATGSNKTAIHTSAFGVPSNIKVKSILLAGTKSENISTTAGTSLTDRMKESSY